jgi:hypothetical protein
MNVRRTPATRCSASRPRRLVNVGSALVGASLIVVLLALPQSGAAFMAVTDNLSNSIAADTLDPPTALVAVGGTSVALSWTATSDAYADGHRIYRSTSPGGPYSQVAEITPRTTETHIDNPAPGTYYYISRAFDGTWESLDSNEDVADVSSPDDYDAVVPASDNCPSHSRSTSTTPTAMVSATPAIRHRPCRAPASSPIPARTWARRYRKCGHWRLRR